MHTWLLPEYIEDVLPAEAARLESYRRQLLDLFRVHGYQYVMPPMMEYVESLLTGTGHDLDIATFKVVDQLTGRLMGLRADTTPQAARIDAHMLNHQGVSRLCYAGTVLRTKPDGLARTREPLQLGAELYGHAGIESDIEVQRLMVKALQLLGMPTLFVDLSHATIFASLSHMAQLGVQQEQALQAALQAKDITLVEQLVANLPEKSRLAFASLTQLNGGIEVLDQARDILPESEDITQALRELETVAQTLTTDDVTVTIDLSELRGYHYHSGMVFAAYAKGYAGPIALGGRYDEVGAAFGRARPATGFSLDLRGALQALGPATLNKGILAPVAADAELLSLINTLRSQGQIVVEGLPDTPVNYSELACDRTLQKVDGRWQVVAV
ncbi:ATP phosphoribosyltransferase regulatory subunit [Methylophilus sp.]|jgi:ATP phosphoribosyltransferase regulatory subunit|uniref:ATP phosphoribosyltransferase regulatory subunit n=1 Tax=Methylophilus sp. TaxID=29541 RepID=UPI0011D99389|nr:ATP phosphoribosyltransferase regulatory subunit [Methylophilus sp.]TXI47505.1 MAG: ATP phosphoribosyltransferase regulatory subunit [Methylophilus sp.]